MGDPWWRAGSGCSREPAQFVKVGWAGENFPEHIFPSMVGRPMLRAEEDAVGDVQLKVGGGCACARKISRAADCGCARM